MHETSMRNSARMVSLVRPGNQYYFGPAVIALLGAALNGLRGFSACMFSFLKLNYLVQAGTLT